MKTCRISCKLWFLGCTTDYGQYWSCKYIESLGTLCFGIRLSSFLHFAVVVQVNWSGLFSQPIYINGRIVIDKKLSPFHIHENSPL